MYVIHVMAWKWFQSLPGKKLNKILKSWNLGIPHAVPHGSWFDYVRAWEELRMRLPADRMHVTSYESMSRDAARETARLAAFLGVVTSPDHCRAVAEACRHGFNISSFHWLNVLWSFQGKIPGVSVRLCICLCVCVQGRLAKLLGRFWRNFPEIVSHRSRGVRLSFEKFGQMMTSWRPFCWKSGNSLCVCVQSRLAKLFNWYLQNFRNIVL